MVGRWLMQIVADKPASQRVEAKMFFAAAQGEVVPVAEEEQAQQFGDGMGDGTTGAACFVIIGAGLFQLGEVQQVVQPNQWVVAMFGNQLLQNVLTGPTQQWIEILSQNRGNGLENFRYN